MASLQPAAHFDVHQAQAIVRDLFKPRAVHYWIDMLLSVLVAYGAAHFYFQLPSTEPLKWLALTVSSFALFRLGSFMHELQHFSGSSMRGFSAGWNLLCGIPMLMPSFLYDNHASHHRNTTYGTIDDGEYLPLGRGAWGHFAIYALQALLLPLLVIFRFLFLTPLALVSAAWRKWVLERFSYYGINPHYRHQPRYPLPRSWWWLEVACMLRAWAIPLAVFLNVTSPWRMIELYLLAVCSIGLNYVRNLAAHRYRNTGEAMDYAHQLEDSINITGHPLWTELLFPVGLRYHALHHLFPTLPYHNLAVAHRRLMRELPPDSPYRRTVHPSFVSVLRQLWHDVQEERQRIGTKLSAA